MTLLLNEETFGSKAKSINELTEKLVSIKWYKNAGKKEKAAEQLLSQLLETLNVSDYTIKWLEKDELSEKLNDISLSGSKLWEKLKDLPDQFKAKIDESNQVDLLEMIVDIVPESIFHHTFEAAFNEFGEEKVVRFLVGQAMYFAVLICVAELANESTFLSLFTDLLSTGHVPIGPKGNIIYII